MTIDERVTNFMECLALTKGAEKDARQLLKATFLEVARDQRLACAEAVNAIDSRDISPLGKSRAHQAVMNAEIK